MSVVERAKVKYPYVPLRKDEIKLEVDNNVDVYLKRESGWWFGKSGSQQGLFPHNFVQAV